MERIRYWATVAFASTLLVAFLSFSAPGAEKAKAEKEGYVGAETCQGCHEEVSAGFKKDAPHWKNYSDPKVAEDMKGCEACHGAGEKHAEQDGKGPILTFKRENVQVKSEACLKCHQKQKGFFQARRGAHPLTGTACSDCHQIHGKKTVGHLLKAKETDLCLSCHQEVKGKFYLPSRHRVLEGAMACTDCHTPHGTTMTRASLKKWNKFNDDVCFKCHPEKRGPWVFEHQAGRTEGCSACHAPHGSPNRFLLARRDIRTLCIECHGQVHWNNPKPPSFSCARCHTQIHGSNFSSRFFQ